MCPASMNEDAGFTIVDDIEGMGNIKVLFIAGSGPIVGDVAVSRKLYNQILEGRDIDGAHSLTALSRHSSIKTSSGEPWDPVLYNCEGEFPTHYRHASGGRAGEGAHPMNSR